MPFTVRPATEADFTALDPIFDEGDAHHREALPGRFQAAAGPPRPRAYLQDLIADDHAALLVAADDDGAVLGFIVCYLHESPPYPIIVPRRYAVVNNIAVTTAARRRGVGRALMAAAHEWARSVGATEVELNVYAFNTGALRFYEELGYAVVSMKLSRPLD